MRALATSLLLTSLTSSCTVPNPDYGLDGLSGPCTLGERVCSGANLHVCVNDTPPHYQLERVCPAPSTCTEGMCVPKGTPCQGVCGSGMVCAVFAVPGTGKLGTYCAQPTGAVAGGRICENNSDCQSGLCVSGGSFSICYQACTKDRGCSGTRLHCWDLKVTLDGVSGTVGGCAP